MTAGSEREVTVSLQPQLTDATVRGRILGDDAKPLRAAIQIVPVAGGPASSAEAEIFEGAYSISLPHGSFNVVAQAPGYRATPVRVDVLPGEVASRDVHLSRVAGMPIARQTPTRIEVTPRIPFAEGTAQLQPAALPIIAEIAEVLLTSGPATIGVRIDRTEVHAGDDELAALVLAEQRAQVVLDALVADGVPLSQLKSHGFWNRARGPAALRDQARLSGRSLRCSSTLRADRLFQVGTPAAIAAHPLA